MFQNKEFTLESDNLTETKERLIMELCKYRKKGKITQTQLSELTNLPQSTISRVESFRHDVTFDTLTKYAEALGMELSIVLKQKDNNILDENLERKKVKSIESNQSFVTDNNLGETPKLRKK